MIGVVDSSALIRLFVPDGPLPGGFVKFLGGVERGVNAVIAPELMQAEVANVLLKKRRTGELTASESDALLAELLAVPIRVFPHRPLIPRAFALADDLSLTVYDTLFLALAEERGAVLFSSDQKLMRAAEQLNLLPP